MPCEHYKDALIEAAAGGAAPHGDLRAHLASCASCRETLAREQSLFAAIDSGLQAAANAEVPPSLLPRVRAGLEDVSPAPRVSWVRPMVFASACVALVLVIFLVARPHRTTPENVAKQNSGDAPALMTPRTTPHPEKIPQTGTQTSTGANPLRPVESSTFFHPVASSNPEVLVPPDERGAFERFLAPDRRPPVQTSVSTERAPKAPRESVEILPVEIASLKVKPLDKDEQAEF